MCRARPGAVALPGGPGSRAACRTEAFAPQNPPMQLKQPIPLPDPEHARPHRCSQGHGGTSTADLDPVLALTASVVTLQVVGLGPQLQHPLGTCGKCNVSAPHAPRTGEDPADLSLQALLATQASVQG